MEEAVLRWMFPEILAPGKRKFLLKWRARRKVRQLLGRKTAAKLWMHMPRLRTLLWADALAATENDPAATGPAEVIGCYPGFYAVSVYRMAHELYLMGLPYIPRMMTEKAHSRTGIDIHPGAQIGRGFFIDHGTGVVIGETTVIGRHVTLYHGVTLGALSTADVPALRGKKRHPTLGDNITVYAGATVLGGDTVIGNGSVIGAGAFVTASLPRNSRVAAREWTKECSRL